MPNQKISELTAIVTVDNSVDVLPIVDISANTTKKVTPNALKTALALDNVNNTSDANKPVSIAQQDALNGKVDENAPIVAATKTKITYDAKGLVTAGDILDAADMPTGINAANIGTGVVSSTEFGYLDGVTSAIQTQLNTKQATLVSGTSIKTINSTSLLGSGDITISASPSGVSGAIQFSNGSAFASDAANLFWDDTNNRLGIGTNAPTTVFQVKTTQANTNGSIGFFYNQAATIAALTDTGSALTQLQFRASSYNFTDTAGMRIAGGTYGVAPTAMLQVVGSGSTSATTSLLVQNSGGTELLKVSDNGDIATYDITARSIYSRASTLDLRGNASGSASSVSLQGFVSGLGWLSMFTAESGKDFGQIPRGAVVNGTTIDASAIFQVNSTTKGFLPPRMTTTQKNAISAIAGLVVYDSTTNKLCCYNGSTWNDLF